MSGAAARSAAGTARAALRTAWAGPLGIAPRIPP